MRLVSLKLKVWPRFDQLTSFDLELKPKIFGSLADVWPLFIVRSHVQMELEKWIQHFWHQSEWRFHQKTTEECKKVQCPPLKSSSRPNSSLCENTSCHLVATHVHIVNFKALPIFSSCLARPVSIVLLPGWFIWPWPGYCWGDLDFQSFIDFASCHLVQCQRMFTANW